MKRITSGITFGVLLLISLPALADHRGGGHWSYGHHEGSLGWWWVVPAAILYSSVAYPPPVTVINQQPPVIVAPQASAPAQPPAQFWYYCDSAKGYYPYVPSCPEAWKPVPVQPPQAAPY